MPTDNPTAGDEMDDKGMLPPLDSNAQAAVDNANINPSNTASIIAIAASLRCREHQFREAHTENAALRADQESSDAALRKLYDGLLEKERETTAKVAAERDEAKRGRAHTQEWYARHYGKLQRWARTELPEPWCTQFFNCVANGTHALSSSDYFRVDTAEGQMILDQTQRAESAEAERDSLRAELEREREKNAWVSVRERFPADMQEVIVTNGFLQTGAEWVGGEWFTREGGYWRHSYCNPITHWRPCTQLPSPPDFTSHEGGK